MKKIITAEPAIEPVTLADVKLQLRIDTSDLDTLLTSFITNARLYCERITRSAFINQTWLRIYDRSDGLFSKREISFLDGLIQSVESIATYDEYDDYHIFDADNYRHNFFRIALLAGKLWPYGLREYDCIEISYTIGYGATADSVPVGIKNAICQLVGFWYENSASIAEMLETGRDPGVPAIIRQSLIPYTQFIV